jgi:hypothetical protein
MKMEAMTPSAFPSVGYAINASRAGKMSLPVSSSAYIYSHFRHVSGVPAPEGVSGVNINRLKILDTLIEQLARMKQQPKPSFGPAGESPDARINALIEQYENQIRNAASAAGASAAAQTGTAMPYSAAASAPPSAALFSLSA